MCGIAGILGKNAKSNLIDDMLTVQHHRGPDYKGKWLEEGVALGHNRLSIIDLSNSANQPFFDKTKRYSIVFNGEIYNYIELRERLKSSYNFQTTSDTEVLLAAFIFWGKDCLKHLNGMFSFAIYDSRSKSLFAARDRFGVKPLYYFISGSGNKKTFTKKNLKMISQSLNQEQKKYSMNLCGGDTTFSKKLSFTITSIGFSNKIVFRNKAKLYDDIYVTGNLGDSFIGLKVLQKKIHLKPNLAKYFTNKYFHPNLHIKITNKLLSIANTSIDISDGLVADLEKLINNQKLSYKLYLNDIPISKNLNKLIDLEIIKKIKSVSSGDDYQILFTASPSKSRIISKISRSLGIKISKIGKICTHNRRSQIIDENNKKITLKNKGYFHRF